MTNETWSDTDKWIFWVLTLPFVMTGVAAFVVVMTALTIIGLVFRAADFAIQTAIVYAVEASDLVIDWYSARTHIFKKKV